jgi:hypothetical protein
MCMCMRVRSFVFQWDRGREVEGRVCKQRLVCRAGQKRTYALYMTVQMVFSLLKTRYIYHVYVDMCGSGQPYLCAL